MTRRLVDRFAPGDPVEVLFRGPRGETWVPARVAAHAHPGLWVEAPDGSRWFVTNGGRIREASAASQPATVYKIASESEWDDTRRTSVFPGSDADRRDGFVHFSTAAQVRVTAAKHFASRRDLVLLDVDTAALAELGQGALRWEPSRGGDLFPHLYAPFPASAVRRARPLPLGPDGLHAFPDDVR